MEKLKLLVIAVLWMGSYYPITINLWNILFSVIPVIIGFISLWIVSGSINERMIKIFWIPLVVSIGIAIYWITSSEGAESEGLLWAVMIALAPIGGFYVGSGIMAGLLFLSSKDRKSDMLASNKSSNPDAQRSRAG